MCNVSFGEASDLEEIPYVVSTFRVRETQERIC